MIKKWNKIDNINGVDSSVVLESHRITQEDEIFLVIDEISGKVSEIQNKLAICSIYNIDPSLTCEEVGNEYVRIVQEQNEQAQKEQVTLEQQAIKVQELTTAQQEHQRITTEGQAKQDTDIKDNMLACVELCDMVLALMPQTFNAKERAVAISHMSKLYVKLVQSGDITIEEVPERYRTEVLGLLG